MRILYLIFLGFHLETIAVFVIVVLEEFLKDNVLVLLEDSGLAVDEGREKTKVLGGQLATSHPRSLSIEALNQIIYFLFGDGCLDGLRIVLKDADKTLLDVFSVDVLGMLEEEIDPSRKVKFILFISHHDLL